jgi:hypothetical protein
MGRTSNEVPAVVFIRQSCAVKWLPSRIHLFYKIFNPSAIFVLDALVAFFILAPIDQASTGAPHNPIQFVDTDPVELCDLRTRHPVVPQGGDATELGDRYLAGLALDGRLSPYQLRFRSGCSHRRYDA